MSNITDNFLNESTNEGELAQRFLEPLKQGRRDSKIDHRLRELVGSVLNQFSKVESTVSDSNMSYRLPLSTRVDLEFRLEYHTLQTSLSQKLRSKLKISVVYNGEVLVVCRVADSTLLQLWSLDDILYMLLTCAISTTGMDKSLVILSTYLLKLKTFTFATTKRANRVGSLKALEQTDYEIPDTLRKPIQVIAYSVFGLYFTWVQDIPTCKEASVPELIVSYNKIPEQQVFNTVTDALIEAQDEAAIRLLPWSHSNKDG